MGTKVTKAFVRVHRSIMLMSKTQHVSTSQPSSAQMLRMNGVLPSHIRTTGTTFLLFSGSCIHRGNSSPIFHIQSGISVTLATTARRNREVFRPTRMGQHQRLRERCRVLGLMLAPTITPLERPASLCLRAIHKRPRQVQVWTEEVVEDPFAGIPDELLCTRFAVTFA